MAAAYDDGYGAGQLASDYHLHAQHQHAGAAPVSITRTLRNHGGLSIEVGNADRGVLSPAEAAALQQRELQQRQHEQQYGGYGQQGDEVGSDDEVAEALQGGAHYQYHHHEADEMHDHQHQTGAGGVEGEEEDIDDDTGSFSDSLSSSPSIPDEDIDFNLVYALHTFLATVEGQASVVKGNELLLLDDSNSYWWLVRVLKTQAIGYIPAENIETPWERLARLNKHRNVDLTSATQADVLSGPTSTMAQTRFIGRIPPSQQPHPHESRHPFAKGVPASPSHKDHPRNISPQPDARPGSSKAKVVLFTAPTYYAHSATGMTTDDEEDGYEEGMMAEGGEHEEGGGFEDEEDEEDEEEEEMDEGVQGGGEESEFSDDGDESTARQQHRQQAPRIVQHPAPADEDADDEDNTAEARRGHSPYDEAVTSAPGREHWERERAAAMQAQEQAAAAEAQWAREREMQAQQQQQQQRDLDLQQQRSRSPSDPVRGALSPVNGTRQSPSPSQQRNLSPFDHPSPRTGGPADVGLSPTQKLPPSLTGSTSSRRDLFDENDFVDPEAPTKKLTATPPIARGEDSSTFAGADPLVARLTPGDRASYASATSGASYQPGPQKVRGVDLVDPRDPRYNRMLQPTKQAGEDLVYERMVAQQQQIAAQQQQQQQQVAQAQAAQGRGSLDYGPGGVGNEADTSMNSVDTGGSSIGEGAAPGKRLSSSGGKSDAGSGSEKKRKSGGGILGLFRKKDKKKKGDDGSAAGGSGDAPRTSEDSAGPSPTTAAFRRSTSSPGSPRSSADRSSSGHGAKSPTPGATTAESMFSTDAALRQQELEAKQALFHQYGVQRSPGDLSNTMTPRGAPGVLVMNESQQGPMSMQRTASSGSGASRLVDGTNSKRNSLQLLNHPSTLIGPNGGLASPSSLAPPQRIRPGSLIGSPSIPRLEVPLLSVMRVFAGAHIDSEATFKTVLLNQSTTAADLVKQAMQRFRLTGADLTREDFYLTVKELGGDERPLHDSENPLQIFEELSDRAGDEGFQLPPSVKRSSIGSITSISSNLSLNPAITRSGVNDWSDDSAVKFYLHRRGSPSSPLVGTAPEDNGQDTSLSAQSVGDETASDHTATPQLGGPSSASPSYRFAVRLLIHPSDLPENVVFDPASNAIIPRAVLAERQQRNGGFSEPSHSPHAREKIIFFPRNANVSEVIETALDRFGIVDGVVDGGDEVEDRVSRRRSVSRVKYSLAVQRENRESFLNASTRLLEAYSSPPLYKAYDRSSKEFRRRSADATLILGSSTDVQPSDPVFILRRSPLRPHASGRSLPQTIDELEELQQRRAAEAEEEQEVLKSSPNPEASRGTSQRDLIAAQRAAQRANQRALLSAQKNDEQGFDINLPGQGTIRSQRDGDGEEVRYSFVHQDGTEVDISEIVENEWQDQRLEAATPTLSVPEQRPTSQMSRAASAATTTDAESFQTATSSLREGPLTSDDEDEERRAIDAMRSTDVAIDGPGSTALHRIDSSSSSKTASGAADGAPHEDHLRSALGPRPMTSPVMNESLQERLDRVLQRVKEEKARRAASPTGSQAGRPRSYISNGGSSATPSGRTSPVSVSARSASVLSGRRSPFSEGLRDSPSIDQLISQSSPRQGGPGSPLVPPQSQRDQQRSAIEHVKKGSIASLSSATSTAAGTDQLSTPVTAGSSSHAFTPATSAHSNHRPQIVYRDDFGFDTLAALVEADARPARRGAANPTGSGRDSPSEILFGRDLDDIEDLHPEVRSLYEAPAKALNDLDARLDSLLLELVNL
ncbi:protein phosphatase regulator BUD14 [Rhodotorula paludigena]|uniref:protein phosphatase regulator BUD14 n=1 Tax=Rhodotorula paludigena TaxID=86838 RepID=UPI0031827DE8